MPESCSFLTGVGHERLTVRTLEYFAETDAEEFFLRHCVSTLSEELRLTYEWEEIYKVCGGNPRLLMACANAAAETLDWNEGEHTCPTPAELSAIMLSAMLYQHRVELILFWQSCFCCWLTKRDFHQLLCQCPLSCHCYTRVAMYGLCEVSKLTCPLRQYASSSVTLTLHTWQHALPPQSM